MKAKVISGIFMVLFLVSSSYIMPAFTLPSGAVSHWTLDEGSGTTAYDSVGANDGTLKNGPVWTTGKVGSALSFDGSDDYVEVPHSADLDITDDLTVEFWFKTNTVNRDGLVSKYWSSGTADRCWMIYLTKHGDDPTVAPRIGTCIYDGGGVLNDFALTFGQTDIQIDTWYHVVFIVSGYDVKMWLNGNLDAHKTLINPGIQSREVPVEIGRWNKGIDSKYYFDGLIDEVAIYNRVLSQEEIQQRYIETGGNVVQATLGRYWIYDEADIFVDSVSGVKTGYLRSRYDISPEGEVEISGARIVLETDVGEGEFHDMSWSPGSGIYTAPSGDPPYTYEWDFGTLNPGQGAMVSLPTYYEADFNIGFEGQRIWDPWITSHSVTQTLTIEFTPNSIDFHNVHVSVQIPKTDEASPTIDPDSISASPDPETEPFEWHMGFDETAENIEVNWGGNPELGITYTFSIEVTVENKLFPEPIFYKPSVGFGANFDGAFSIPDTPNPIISDDIDRSGLDESAVTYYGDGAFTWMEYVQSEHAISFPWCSLGFNEIYTKWEGEASVRSRGLFLSGSAILRVNKEPNTVKLSVEDNDLWWEIIEYRCGWGAIRLVCIPTSAGGGGGEPGPAPIVVTVWSFENSGLATISGCVRFTGENTEIEIIQPSP